MSSRDPLSFKDLLGEVGPRLGLKKAASTGALWARWGSIVGPEVASHAEPTSLKEGVLRVRTDSPMWATEIGYLVEEIRARANEALGTDLVTEVKVWTGPAPVTFSRRPPAGPQRPHEEPGGEAARAPERDPEEAFAAAREAWIRRARGR